MLSVNKIFDNLFCKCISDHITVKPTNWNTGKLQHLFNRNTAHAIDPIHLQLDGSW